jgi:hypothetical protein
MKPTAFLLVFASFAAGCGSVARSPVEGSDASRPAVDASPTLADLPARILFVCDVSGGVALTDPAPSSCAQAPCLSRRGQAIADTVAKYPPGDAVRYGIISFSSNASVLTTGPDGQSGFTTEKNDVMAALPSLSAMSGQASYDSALTLAFQVLEADMQALGATARRQARYEIVFISADVPTPDDTLPGESIPAEVKNDVLNIAGLETTDAVALVSLNTIYINGIGTPAAEMLQAGSLLASMAALAAGQYRQVDSNQSISLSYIDFTSNGGG